MKVIIAGSRDFTFYKMFCNNLEYYLQYKLPHIEIVSGGARGPDAMAIQYAKDNDLKCTIFEADWETNGKAAGPIRNEEMAKYADALIAFWDGKSRGTKHMIDIATQYGLKVRVVNIK